MSVTKATPAEGVELRHSKHCDSRSHGRCGCTPTYQANVWDNTARKRVRRSFKTLAAAKKWRRDALTALEHGHLQTTRSATIAEAAADFLTGADSGAVRNRSGRTYKPSTVRGYEACLRLRVLPRLGHLRITEVRRRDLQRFVDDLLQEGLDPSTVVKTANPLQAIFRRLAQREEVVTNPAADLDLPKGRRRRERIASPEEAAELLGALPVAQRALWATAVYAGLRRSELRALRVVDLDMGAGVIRVERSWDAVEGEQDDGKSVSARRKVPIVDLLGAMLEAHLEATGRAGDALVFGRTAAEPFCASTVRNRAIEAWGERPIITLHEGRHTFASLMIAAGVNAKALSVYMGHSTIAVTFDLYGHLMPGSEAEAADLLNAYLASSRRDTGATSDPAQDGSRRVDAG